MTYQENLTEGAEEVAEATLMRPVADDKTYEPPVDTGDPNQPTRPDPGDANGAELDGGEGNDLLIGGDGADVIEAAGLEVVVSAATTEAPGEYGDDLIVINEGDDAQAGNRGNDIVLGEEGTDLLIVNNGDGSDFLEEAEASATNAIPGGSGNDVLIGDDGRDITIASDGNDFALGQDGNDLLIVNNGDESDFLESAAIDINLLSGNDPNPSDGTSVMGEYEPHYPGGSGNDVLLGDKGNDRSASADDLLDQPEAPGDPNEPTRPDPGDGENDTPGQDGSDLLIVNNGDGSDFLEETDGGSSDVLRGGAGNDTLLGNRGNDVVLGQDGNDFATDDGAETPILEGGWAEIPPAAHDSDLIVSGRGNDILLSGDGNDVMAGAAHYDPYKAFKFQVQTGEAADSADQIIFRSEGDDTGSVSEAYFVKADAETTTQSGDDESEDSIVVDYGMSTILYLEEVEPASGFTPLIAFAPDVETPLDLDGADAMMSFDDIM